MKVSHEQLNFRHGRAMVKGATCLLLLTAGCVNNPVFAAQESFGITSTTSLQQAGAVKKGVILDVNGEPIIGASVVEKGNPTNGTVTDINGNYTLKVKNAKTPLVVSYIGFITQETGGGKMILKEDLKALNEVVVIGYGTQRKGDVTSSITSVKAEDFAQGNIQDAGDLIKGKVAGLTISNGSGDPNATSQIRLRGIVSLEGGNSPLVLIDGIEGDLSTVAPENIESIDVLKDASAAAIYGTRGASGVIIITTKSGKRDSNTTASYSGYLSLSNFTKTLDMMDGADIRAGKNSQTDRGYDTDWIDAITRTALTHNHNFNITGGNKTTSYSADFTYRHQEGSIIETYSDALNFNGTVSHWMMNDMLKVSFNIVKRWHKQGPMNAASEQVYRQALMRNPTEPIYDETGDYYENFGVNYYYNPVGMLKETTGSNRFDQTRLTGNVTFEPIKGWQTNLMLATDRYTSHSQYYNTSKHYSQKLNYHTGYASQSMGRNQSDNLELTSRYKHQWGEHRFEGMVGYSYQQNVYESFYANNTNFMSDFFEYNNLGIGEYLKDGKAGMGSGKSSDKLIGFFGRVSYGYADKYNVLISIRREGSSKFGDNHKWGSFPSASLGWTISNEEFMKSTRSWLDNLKLRAGLGVTGVIPGSPYLSLTKWSLGYPYFYENGKWNQGLLVSSNPNPNLKWEKSTEINVGLDWSVLGERLSGTIDFYNKKTVDMLWWYTVPSPPNLYTSTLANVGEMRNTGIEVAVTAVPFKTKDFEWKTTLTASHNSNKLLSLSNDLYESNSYYDEGYLGEPISLPTQRLEPGRSVGNFYGMKTTGVSENGLWMIENKETGESEEFTDNMLTDDKYHQYLGNALPKVVLGWGHQFTYKNFDLSMQFTGQFGFKILNEAKAYYENNAVAYNRMKSAAEAPFGDGNVLSVAQKQTFTSYHLENGDFVKLSNMTLGYNVPLKENKFVNKIRAYVSGSNLFCITGYDGLDPELTNGDRTQFGIDRRDKYPSSRTFTFGLNVTF